MPYRKASKPAERKSLTLREKLARGILSFWLLVFMIVPGVWIGCESGSVLQGLSVGLWPVWILTVGGLGFSIVWALETVGVK